jgi:hypothetical protein
LGNQPDFSPPSTHSMPRSSASAPPTTTGHKPVKVVDTVEYLASVSQTIEDGFMFNTRQKTLDSRISKYECKQKSGIEDPNEKASIDEDVDKQRKLLVELMKASCQRGFEEVIVLMGNDSSTHHHLLDAMAVAADFCMEGVHNLKAASDAGGMEAIAVSIMMQTQLFLPLFR